MCVVYVFVHVCARVDYNEGAVSHGTLEDDTKSVAVRLPSTGRASDSTGPVNTYVGANRYVCQFNI